MVFVIGHLNMATLTIAPVTDFEVESGESAVEVAFVNEDDLPLSCVHSGNTFLEHPESDEEGESEDDEELETDKSIWIEEITTRIDVDFNQAVGMAVDPASLNAS